tara:strand:+ start:234 stop:437 length:204 start_codon:yes stop_codon:yes gene_type:complete
VRGKGAVGGIEQMMTFVEDISLRQHALLAATHGRLDHHQGMIGDHYVGRPGPSDGPFDEAFAIVIAR